MKTVEEMVRTLQLDVEPPISQELNRLIPLLVEPAVKLRTNPWFARVKRRASSASGDLLRHASPVMMRILGAKVCA